MADICVDRSRLADYIKQHAQAIADGALLDLHTVKIETNGGETKFVQTVDVEIREVPLEAVECL